MLTGAIVDRLAHKAHILDMSIEVSYRLEEPNWLKRPAYEAAESKRKVDRFQPDKWTVLG